MATLAVRRRLVGGSVAALIALSAVAASGSVTLASGQAVRIAGFAFSPQIVRVSVGDSIHWSNEDGVTHTATADGGAFDTGSIGAGSASADVTFNTAGTFAYHCRIHTSMTGTIVVMAADSPPPTDTVVPSSPRAASGPPWAVLALATMLGLMLAWHRMRRVEPD